MVGAEERDAVEGRYTQAQPETAEDRVVHGQYTEGQGHPGPETEVVGAYVGTEREGKPPIVRSAHQRIGNYPKAEHEGTSSHRQKGAEEG